jgi:hypothetical protein
MQKMVEKGELYLTNSAFSSGEASEATDPSVATPSYTPNLKIKSQ